MWVTGMSDCSVSSVDSRRLQVFFIFAPRPAQFGAHPTLCPVTTEGSVHRGHETHHNFDGIITFVIIRAI